MIELKNSRVTRLPDAPDGRQRFAVDAHIGAIQMREDAGKWLDIDPTLDSNGQPKYVPYIITPYLIGMPGFHYRSKQSGEFDIRLKAARSISLRDSPTIVASIPVPRIEGRQIIWSDIYPDTDVILVVSNTRVSLKRILKSNRAPLEYDVDIDELEEGIAKLVPLRPAIDAIGQSLVMEEGKITGGRTESLKLEFIEELEAQEITYPIEDATVVSESVGASEDDDYVNRAGSTWSNSDWHFRAGGSFRYGSYARFTSVNVPSGATVTIAYMTIDCRQASSGATVRTDLCCENSSNPGRTISLADHVGRARTADVEWDSIGAWTLGTEYQTPSIVAAVQEVVNDQGGTGDALIVFWEDKDNRSDAGANRIGTSFDVSNGYSPVAIYIEYTTGAPPAVEHYGFIY